MGIVQSYISSVLFEPRSPYSWNKITKTHLKDAIMQINNGEFRDLVPMISESGGIYAPTTWSHGYSSHASFDFSDKQKKTLADAGFLFGSRGQEHYQEFLSYAKPASSQSSS